MTPATLAPPTRGPLLFFDFVTHYGGSNKVTVMLTRELRKTTEVVVVDAFGACPDYLADLRQAGIATQVLFPAWAGRKTIGGGRGLRRARRLLLAAPDMLRVVLRLRAVLRELRPRAMWVNSQKALFPAWLAAPPSLPLAMFVHNELRAIRPYCALAWRRANAAIGVSDDSLRYLRSTPYAHRTFHVIHNGIDFERVLSQAAGPPEPLPVSAPGRLRVVVPARISPEKGHTVALRALARLRELGGRAELLVCGDVLPGATQDYFAGLQRMVAELGLGEAVHFLGWRKDMLAVLRVADVVLLPSLSGEGLPISLMEAMALARPVVAARVGGVPELVRDEQDGLLVERGDAEAMAQALLRMGDAGLRERLGASGRWRVRESFSLQRQATEFVGFMDQLAASPVPLRGAPLGRGEGAEGEAI